MRIELRLGEAGGRLVTASGDVNATDIRTIIHTEQGYQLADARAPVLGQGFLPCLIHTLDAGQQAMLGASQLTAHELGDRIARLASADRERTAKLMGLTPIAERYRPPLRIDSRVGYALSGGGESSRRAIRSGIHDIFPTLTDAQLDAYLRNLADRGVGLWDHLSQLQRQLHSLREALDTWQRQRVSFMDGLRRQRVANQIRRTWRRKTAGLAGDDFSLHIDGEEVGSLPSLPADIDFGHVRRLTLRNMALEQIEEDFLRRFTHLRELDLRNNQLTRLPVGLEQFTGLRSLHLAGNQIIVDTPGSQRLASLTSLQVLDLNYNPLGQVPDLSSLRHLREVSLRATGLQTLPDEAAMPWRGLVDMRENQIRQVTGHLRTLGAVCNACRCMTTLWTKRARRRLPVASAIRRSTAAAPIIMPLPMSARLRNGWEVQARRYAPGACRSGPSWPRSRSRQTCFVFWQISPALTTSSNTRAITEQGYGGFWSCVPTTPTYAKPCSGRPKAPDL